MVMIVSRVSVKYKNNIGLIIYGLLFITASGCNAGRIFGMFVELYGFVDSLN